MPTKKWQLDHDVAIATGEKLRDVSYITQVFLDELTAAIAKGVPVHLRGFGTFTITRSKDVPTGHKRFGKEKGKISDTGIRFRVQFSKASGLKREIRKKYKENKRWISSASTKR